MSDKTPNIQNGQNKIQTKDVHSDASSDLSKHVEMVQKEYDDHQKGDMNIYNDNINDQKHTPGNQYSTKEDDPQSKESKTRNDVTLPPIQKTTATPGANINTIDSGRRSPVAKENQFQAMQSDRSHLNTNMTKDIILQTEATPGLELKNHDIEKEGKSVNILNVADDIKQGTTPDKRSQKDQELVTEVKNDGLGRKKIMISILILIMIGAIGAFVLIKSNDQKEVNTITPAENKPKPQFVRDSIDTNEKVSVIESQLISLFKTDPLVLVDFWKYRGPFNIHKYVKENELSVDQSFYLSNLKKTNEFDWTGQSSVDRANGIGRNQGSFGIYEGNYQNGLPHGFGRWIINSESMFTGHFIQGQIHGDGTYQLFVKPDEFSTLNITGTWINGVLKESTSSKKQIGYDIKQKLPPLVQIKLNPTVKSLSENMSKTPKLDSIKDVSDSQQTGFNKMVETWQKSQPLNINNLEKKGLVKVDQKLKVTTIQSSDYTYNGQVVKKTAQGRRRQLQSAERALISQGIGQQYGTWGIYEGEFTQGQITGYGRIITPTQNVYEGQFVNGTYDGNGTLSLKNGTKISGMWKNNILVKTVKGRQEPFKADSVSVPPVYRSIPKIEQDLIRIFETFPISDQLNQTNMTQIKSQWTKAGPFQIENYVNNKSIILDKNLAISQYQHKEEGFQYQGQVRVNSTIGMYKNNSIYYQSYNKNNITQYFGIGQITTSQIIFEGSINPESWQNPKELKIFRITTKNSSKTYYTYNLTNEIMNELKPIISIVLNSYEINDWTMNLTKLWEQMKGIPDSLKPNYPGEWFLDYYMKNIYVIENKTIVQDKNGSYGQGTMGKSGIVINGFGRMIKSINVLGSTQKQIIIYDGQMVNNKKQGYGQYYNGTWTKGYFNNDTYCAVNQTVCELMNLFNDNYTQGLATNVPFMSFPFMELLKQGNIGHLHDNNKLHGYGRYKQVYPLGVIEHKESGSRNSQIIWQGVFVFTSRRNHNHMGIFRKITINQDNSMSVTDGSDNYYRIINSQGSIKWRQGRKVISESQFQTMCKGMIYPIQKSNNITMPYNSQYKLAPTGVNFNTLFNNLEPVNCPVTSCKLYQGTKLYKGQLSFQSQFPFALSSINTNPQGYNDTLKVVCNYSDSQVITTMLQVQQLPCGTNNSASNDTSNQCPVFKNVTKEVAGKCNGTLTSNRNINTTITIPYSQSNEYQYINYTALEFFNNSNTGSCGIQNCSLRELDCNKPVRDGVRLKDGPSFPIYALSNDPDGWIKPMCMVCENQDEQISIKIEIDQLSCSDSGSCPKAKSGECKNHLKPVKQPKDLIMPYTPNDRAHYSRINADSFFDNTNQLYCPIERCVLMEESCYPTYKGGVIYVDERRPFGLFAHTDFPEGFSKNLCLVCYNQDVGTAVNLNFTQNSCNVTGNCGVVQNVTQNITNGSCSGMLDHIPNPNSIVVPFNPTSQIQYTNVNATQFFINKNPEQCPITNCTLKQPNCIDNYPNRVFVDEQDPFGIFMVANTIQGWIDPMCLICENQNEIVAIEIVIDQLDCRQTGNCQDIQPRPSNVSIGFCNNTLTPIQNPQPVIFNYTESNDLQYLPFHQISAVGYFNNSDPQNCPITQCMLMNNDCKTAYPHGVFVDQQAPFGFSAYTNWTSGWIDPVCLMCSNQDQTVSLNMEIDQLSCSQTGNCPDQPEDSCVDDLVEDPGFMANPKPVVVRYAPSNAPQYSQFNATQVFVSKNETKCPILNCTVRQQNCITPYNKGITIDPRQPFGMFIQSNFPDGWMDTVCVVCSNKDEQFGVNINVQQQSCQELGNCQSNHTFQNVTHDTNNTGICDHSILLRDTWSSNQIRNVRFPYVNTQTEIYTRYNATQWFHTIGYNPDTGYTNQTINEQCQVSNCSIKQPDCEQDFPDGLLSVDPSAPFGIFAKPQPNGYNMPACLICENQDEIVSVDLNITQDSCQLSNNCPQTVNVTDRSIEKIECKDHLKPINLTKNQSQIIIPFQNTRQQLYTRVDAQSFFSNDDPERCPITGCMLMMPGCKKNYTTEISIKQEFPFSIFAQQNYPDGWIDPVCLMCSNIDETVTIDIEIDQLSCNQSQNCPNATDLVPTQVKKGECLGSLINFTNPRSIQVPFDANPNQIYSRVNAENYFQNTNPEKCPITNCKLMNPGCQEKFEFFDEISIDSHAPFGIFIRQNFPNGWRDPVCLICGNQDENKTASFNITQQPCQQGQNCPSNPSQPPQPEPQPTVQPGQCRNHLTSISNPQKIVIPFSSSTNQLYTRVNAQSFFTNDDPQRCPIKGCMLMQPGCKKNYTTEVTVDPNPPFGIFAQQNYPLGWLDPVCLMCSNQDETVTINIEIDQLSCEESKNCPNGTLPSQPQAQPGQCKGHLQAIANPTPIGIPYNDQSNGGLEYTFFNALSMYTNDDPQLCPIKTCYLQKPGCTSNYTQEDGIDVDGNFPFGIFAVQSFAFGKTYEGCLQCSNQDQTVTQNFTVNQWKCGENGSSPCQIYNVTTNESGPCNNTLQPNNGFPIVADYVPTNNTQFTRM